MPYNYLIDSQIRCQFKIDYENSIVIFDEAHNIGRVSEDVSSFELNSETFWVILGELNTLGKNLEVKADTKEFMSNSEVVNNLRHLIMRIKERILKFELNQPDRIIHSKLFSFLTNRLT
jgi:regulator of telomere elongation helicase 1